jgi:hypothetical protein
MTSYRSLNTGFWPADMALGRRSVIYGHNGSGKSSFASLLLEIASSSAPQEVVWEDELGARHRIGVGQGGPAPSMAVFTKAWVERNLSEFLDGDTASPIVTLGEEAIEAKDEEGRLEEEIGRLRIAAGEADKKRKDLSDKAEKLAREAQSAIASQLQEFSYARFTKNRYSITALDALLRDYKGDYPDENEQAEALKRLGEGAAEPVSQVPAAPTSRADMLAGLEELLAETPVRAAIAALETDPGRQRWVEAGLSLHEELDNCLYCDGPISGSSQMRV